MAQDPHSIGRYVIQRVLGRGAMGVVYLAQDPLLKRPVAIKTMRDGGGGDEQESTMERFKREAEISARLNHPNIITVYDVGVDPAMGPFLAMEYIDGASLASLSRHGIAPEVGLRLLVQGMAALQSAAEAGIVHRDVKPENMLVRRDGRLKLMDFGIARGGDSRLTQAGMVFGTPSYTAPELLTGSDASPATDRYAFAVTAFEMFTGRLPFHGSSVGSTLYRIVHEAPAFPEDMDLNLQLAFAKAFMKDPADRWEHLPAFMLALSEALPISPEFRMKLHNLIEGDESFGGSTLHGAKISGPFGNDRAEAAPALASAPLITEFIELPDTDEEAGVDVELPELVEPASPVHREPPITEFFQREQPEPSPPSLHKVEAGHRDGGSDDAASLAAAALLEDSDSWVAGLFLEHAPEPIRPGTGPLPQDLAIEAPTAEGTPAANQDRPSETAGGQPELSSVERSGASAGRPDLHPKTLLEPVKPAAAAPGKGLRNTLLGLAAVAVLAFGFIKLVPGSRRVDITSTPPGATVYLFGKFLGTTPLSQAKIPGKAAVLKFELQGFLALNRELKQGEDRVEVTLEGLPWTTAVRTDPPGAEVFINEVSKGVAPLSELQVPSTGPQVLLLRLKGYADSVITLDKDVPLADPVVLTPVSFKAAVVTDPAGAEISLNGMPRGRTPKELEITSAANQVLTLRLKGYEDWVGRLEPGKPLPNPIPLKVKILKLSVHSEPQGAAVFLDGKQIGITPLEGLPVSMNQTHQLKLVREGYVDWTGPFDLTAELPKPVRLVPKVRFNVTPGSSSGPGAPLVPGTLPLEPETPKQPTKKPGFWKRIFGGDGKKEAPKQEGN